MPHVRISARLAALAFASVVAANAQAQSVIDVPASLYCTVQGNYLEVPIGSGLYRLDPVGPAGGGLFSGYNGAEGQVSFCSPEGTQCFQGWLWELIYQVGYTAWPNIINNGPCGQCATPEQALACLPPGTHAAFAATQPTVLRLAMQISCPVSVGGVSVLLTARLAIVTQPAPIEICPGGDATCSISAVGSTEVAYRWEWREAGQSGDWLPLLEGTNLDNAGVPAFSANGTVTPNPSLRDNHLQGGVDVIMALRCIVSNAAGEVTSAPVPLTLLPTSAPACAGPTCDADVNCDFALDGFDVEVQEKAVGGDITDYCQPDPDFNRDFALDGFDVEAVELVVGGGPCP